MRLLLCLLTVFSLMTGSVFAENVTPKPSLAELKLMLQVNEATAEKIKAQSQMLNAQYTLVDAEHTSLVKQIADKEQAEKKTPEKK